MFTTDMIDAAEAERIGLAEYAVPLAEFDAESSVRTHPESAGFFAKMKDFFEGIGGT